LGGAANILTRGKAEEISLSLSMDVPDNQPLEYTLSLAAQGIGYSITSEILQQKREGHNTPFKHIESNSYNIQYYDIEKSKLIRVNWDYEHLETSLSQVPKMYKQPEDLRRILSSTVKYHALDVSSDAPVKRPQQMRPATGPGINGEDLVTYLYYLRETSKDKFEIITDSLKAAFPDFEELSFPPVAAGMLAMTWKNSSFTRPVYLHELSEGSLRFLWLVSLLQSSNLSAVTMIDEPDVSLHPKLMQILVEMMREASQKTQLIIATHSDRFVRFLKPEELKIFDLDENGCTNIISAEKLDLEKWLSDYTLSDLWTMGVLNQ
jgi:predicted ATPase